MQAFIAFGSEVAVADLAHFGIAFAGREAQHTQEADGWFHSRTYALEIEDL